MILVSMSSSLSPISGANFPSIVALKRASLGPTASRDQTLVLTGLAFIAFFRRTLKVTRAQDKRGY